jgi:hypothetical protein
LSLHDCKRLFDAGIQGLERIPTLEELDIGGTVVTKVNHLASCRALKVLNLSDAS